MAQFGSGGWSAGVAPVTRGQELPKYQTVSSKKDLAKTEPSSNAGGISVKIHLRSNKHCPTATIERSEEKVQKKQPCRHQGLWWRRGKRCFKSWSRSPAAHGEGRVQVGGTPAAQEGQHGNRHPPCSRDLCPEGSCSPGWSCSWRTAATLEQFLRDCIPWEGAHAGVMEECGRVGNKGVRFSLGSPSEVERVFLSPTFLPYF